MKTDGLPLKIIIINKSDSTGGAAVVSRRLMEALREQGADARMVVAEKLSDSPYVSLASSPERIKSTFLWERLKIFIANGFNRKTLFKIDTGETGLPLWRHPLVEEADAVLINWVNQGMLSLEGVRKIVESGKDVIWTMHDMWNMTGICHHAGECTHFCKDCGECPLLGCRKSGNDLSFKIWKRKNALYEKLKSERKGIKFVAVSNWLYQKAIHSSLLKHQNLTVIPNAFPVRDRESSFSKNVGEEVIRIIFGAARLDDPIKGLDTLREVSHILSAKENEGGNKYEIAMFGSLKNPEALEGFALPVKRLGVIKGEEEIRRIYESSRILVSSSSYETLPGTLVEAQWYGAIPVAFDRGGQRDIIAHLQTGYIAEYDDELRLRAENLAAGIEWAARITGDEKEYEEIIGRMRENVERKFSCEIVASRYLELIRE